MNIKDLYFSIIAIEVGPQTREFIIVSAEEKLTKAINRDGEIEVGHEITLIVVDIDASISAGEPIIDDLIISNEDEFVENVKIVDPAVAYQKLVLVTEIIVNTIIELENFGRLLGNSIACVKKIASELNENKADGRLVINGYENNIASIAFAMIKGGVPEISSDEIQQIGTVILNTIVHNMNIDLDNPSEVKELKELIEINIINALPNDVKAEDLNIDENKIAEEIKKIRDLRKKNDNRDNEDNDDNDESDDD